MTKSNLSTFDALGRLDDAAIRARGLEMNASVEELQQQLLGLQIDAVMMLVGEGMTAKDALALVVGALGVES